MTLSTRARIGSLAAILTSAVLVLGACSAGSTTAPTASAGASGSASALCPDGYLTIGSEFPMSGAETSVGGPAANGVKLAIKHQNEKGGVAGCELRINVQDDAVNGVHDPQQGAKNVATLIADATVIGIVGPDNSNVAQAQIPITNEVGLLQCSPSTTMDLLTRPPEGDKYRTANPDKIAYVRVATLNGVQGPAAAAFAYKDLGSRAVYILDDTETFGSGVADTFQAEFERLGGKVVKRDGAPKSTMDYTALFTAAAALNPDSVFLGGTTASGMGLALKQGRTVPGIESIPFVGPDGITDLARGGDEGAFLTVTGAAGHDVYGTVAAAYELPDPEAFNSAYKAEFGMDPGQRSPTSYACTQVIIQALETANATATDLVTLRAAVRAAGTDITRTFDTVMGPITFDKYGDNTTPFVSYFKTDLSLNDGKGDWTFIKQVAFENK